eukprot:TRINITY_DN1266_c0_g1_i3.p2 TRINITY_DN1266_c0_g1~~TRINITY_DN1266_c0_g1_i3.p2  ORF type:complete len:397 (-),score=-16.87 TRINITY_DN1266_c0_g1_i3:174-1364(-)
MLNKIIFICIQILQFLHKNMYIIVVRKDFVMNAHEKYYSQNSGTKNVPTNLQTYKQQQFLFISFIKNKYLKFFFCQQMHIIISSTNTHMHACIHICMYAYKYFSYKICFDKIKIRTNIYTYFMGGSRTQGRSGGTQFEQEEGFRNLYKNQQLSIVRLSPFFCRLFFCLNSLYSFQGQMVLKLQNSKIYNFWFHGGLVCVGTWEADGIVLLPLEDQIQLNYKYVLPFEKMLPREDFVCQDYFWLLSQLRIFAQYFGLLDQGRERDIYIHTHIQNLQTIPNNTNDIFGVAGKFPRPPPRSPVPESNRVPILFTLQFGCNYFIITLMLFIYCQLQTSKRNFHFIAMEICNFLPQFEAKKTLQYMCIIQIFSAQFYNIQQSENYFDKILDIYEYTYTIPL